MRVNLVKLMKQIAAVLCTTMWFIAACGPIPDKDKPTPRPQRGTPSGSKATATLNSAEFAQFKQEFDTRFGAYDSLPPETLYQIIDAVPSQSTTWGCGLVQSNMARAAASLSLGLAIEHQQVANCNTVQDYPLMADEPLTPETRQELEEALKVKIAVQNVNGVDRFRVGADPRMLPDYLNSKLPPTVRASIVEKPSLTKNELVSLVEESLATSMPLITLTLVSAAALRVHYYSVVGVDSTANKLLVLHTEGPGLQRLKEFDITDFINSMNMSSFRSRIKQFIAYAPLIAVLKPDLKLPDLSRLNSLANFNLIKFDKTP